MCMKRAFARRPWIHSSHWFLCHRPLSPFRQLYLNLVSNRWVPRKYLWHEVVATSIKKGVGKYIHVNTIGKCFSLNGLKVLGDFTYIIIWVNKCLNFCVFTLFIIMNMSPFFLSESGEPDHVGTKDLFQLVINFMCLGFSLSLKQSLKRRRKLWGHSHVLWTQKNFMLYPSINLTPPLDPRCVHVHSR